MEKTDVELIGQYTHADPELALLWNEHQGFEKRLEKLERKPYLSADEQLERNDLKKKKLVGRDQIEQILKRYRR